MRRWRVSRRSVSLFVMLCSYGASGELPKPKVAEGSAHGYLIVRDATRKVVASGEYTQRATGNRLVSRIVFRFRDGSLDDESTVFLQDHGFHLVADHHVQKGPSFPDPIEAWIDTSSRQVRLRQQDRTKSEHMALPAELSNGFVFTLVKDLKANAPPFEIPYLAESSSPRLTTLAIAREGEDQFRVGPTLCKATRYVIKVKLGGLTGLVAPIIGKQPSDSYVWVAGGNVPTIVRVDTALFNGGPMLTIEPATPVW